MVTHRATARAILLLGRRDPQRIALTAAHDDEFQRTLPGPGVQAPEKLFGCGDLAALEPHQYVTNADAGPVGQSFALDTDHENAGVPRRSEMAAQLRRDGGRLEAEALPPRQCACQLGSAPGLGSWGGTPHHRTRRVRVSQTDL